MSIEFVQFCNIVATKKRMTQVKDIKTKKYKISTKNQVTRKNKNGICSEYKSAYCVRTSILATASILYTTIRFLNTGTAPNLVAKSLLLAFWMKRSGSELNLNLCFPILVAIVMLWKFNLFIRLGAVSTENTFNAAEFFLKFQLVTDFTNKYVTRIYLTERTLSILDSRPIAICLTSTSHMLAIADESL